MSRPLRWLGYAAGAIVVLAVIAVATIWVLSERVIFRKWDVAVEPVTVPSDSATLVRGQHVISILGCSGCHGRDFEGRVFFDEPRVARVVAPNLTEAVSRYSNDSLALVIRDGVNSEGRGVLAMPSSAFYNLSRADIGAIIAALRAVPKAPSAVPLPPNEYRFFGRLGLVLGQFQSEPDRIDRSRPRVGDSGDTTGLGRGRYLAMTSCIECHGSELQGAVDTPSLAGAYGYSLDEFVRLARTATPREPRTLDLMARVATDRLSHMTDDELGDLHMYLQSVPATPPSSSDR